MLASPSFALRRLPFGRRDAGDFQMDFHRHVMAAMLTFGSASGSIAAAESVDSRMRNIAAEALAPGHKDARDVVAFWREAGPNLWFAKDAAFDQRFRERYALLHEQAARGELTAWLSSPEGSLALVILLDQYPRNSFRGTARMYATDPLARDAAKAAIAAGHDRAIAKDLRLFLYLPFGHSEGIADQDRSVELCRRLGEPYLTRAEHHRDIVKRFGRFPHRNPILGRPMRPEEQRYLDEGGYKG
jgi:uncharacterized protein (DUF924 family)